MYVKDWMTKNPVCLSADNSVMDAFNAMKEGDFHRIPICDNGKIIGLITNTTLADYTPSKATTLSVFEINSLLQKTTCKDIMVKDVVTITSDALLEEAADKMMVNNITCLPVIDKDTEKLIGIITQKVIFGAFVDLMGYYAHGSRIVIQIEKDQPGVLEKVAHVLAQNNINISHLAVYHYDNVSIVVRVYDEDATKIKDLFEANGYKVTDYRINKID